MPFLTGPALYLIVALLCTNGIAGVMWFVKNAEAKQKAAEVVACKAEFAAFTAQYKAQGDLAIERERAKVKRQEQITERVKHEYATDLAALRADYDRLRKQYARARSDGVSAIPVAPTRIDEIPLDALPLAAECAETTLTLVSLQDWIKEQEK